MEPVSTNPSAENALDDEWTLEFLARYQGMDDDEAVIHLESIEATVLSGLVKFSAGDDTLYGAGRFLQDVAQLARPLSEAVLLDLIQVEDVRVRESIGFRDDLTASTAILLAVKDLELIAQGEDTFTSIFTSPLLPSWMLGTLYRFITSESAYSSSGVVSDLAAQLVGNPATPLVAKAKLTLPGTETEAWGGWVEPSMHGSRLQPQVAELVESEFPELVDFPVTMLVEVLRHQDLADDVWGVVPREYQDVVDEFSIAELDG